MILADDVTPADAVHFNRRPIVGFATETDVIVKMLGFGMAVAILLDATVVRLVLVPATMAMLGRFNWWLPAWLDRLLPRVDAEASEDLWDELDDLEQVEAR